MSDRKIVQQPFGGSFQLIHYFNLELEGQWQFRFTEVSDWGKSDAYSPGDANCTLLLELKDGSKERLLFKERSIIAVFRAGLFVGFYGDMVYAKEMIVTPPDG